MDQLVEFLQANLWLTFVFVLVVAIIGDEIFGVTKDRSEEDAVASMRSAKSDDGADEIRRGAGDDDPPDAQTVNDLLDRPGRD